MLPAGWQFELRAGRQETGQKPAGNAEDRAETKFEIHNGSGRTKRSHGSQESNPAAPPGRGLAAARTSGFNQLVDVGRWQPQKSDVNNGGAMRLNKVGKLFTR